MGFANTRSLAVFTLSLDPHVELWHYIVMFTPPGSNPGVYFPWIHPWLNCTFDTMIRSQRHLSVGGYRKHDVYL